MVTQPLDANMHNNDDCNIITSWNLHTSYIRLLGFQVTEIVV